MKHPVWITFATHHHAIQFEEFCKNEEALQPFLGMRDRNKVEMQFDSIDQANHYRNGLRASFKKPGFKNKRGVMKIQ